MEAVTPILDALQSALPLIIAAVVSAALTSFNKHVGSVVPKEYYPILLPIAGAIVASVAKAVGFDVGDFNPETARLDTWQTIVAGALTGHAMVGMNQIKKQLQRPPDEEEPPT